MHLFLKVILGTSYACKYKITWFCCTLEWDSGAATDFNESLDELSPLLQIFLLGWDKRLYYLGSSFADCSFVCTKIIYPSTYSFDSYQVLKFQLFRESQIIL